MGEGSKIEWTDHTFNPWWGCSRVSPACDHCYAEAFAHRLGMDLWEKGGERRHFGDAHWREPLRWNAKAEAAGVRARVFCASMADVFEDNDDVVDDRRRLWDLVEATPWLTWLLLTKRPQNVLQLVPPSWVGADDYGAVQVDATHRVPLSYLTSEELRRLPTTTWPANVWVGTTVESQGYARVRIPRLLEVPAPVRFLSCEPLLGEVRLARWLWDVDGDGPHRAGGLGWVIAGGESGHGARPLDPRWVRILQRECEHAAVPFLFKQWGGRTPKAGGRELDGRTWDEVPA